MKIIKPITESEMIISFLSAEYASSRFAEGTQKALAMLGYSDDLIIQPNLKSHNENIKRAKILGLTRGWPDKYLFTSFPKNTKWFMVSLENNELCNSYRLKSDVKMTDKERKLENTARNIILGKTVSNIDANLITQIKTRIESGEELPPIILVAKTLHSKRVLVEGHSRSVAYCASKNNSKIYAILGLSEVIDQWEYF